MTPILFSDEAPRGWIPPSLAAPVLCIVMVALGSVPFDLALEHFGLTDALGNPRGPLGLCLLLVSFLGFGLLVAGWVRLVERRSLASAGLTGPHRVRRFLWGLAAGVAMMGAIVAAIALSGGYRVGAWAPALASPAALGWIALLLGCFALQASIEEFVFRGWLFSAILRRWNAPAAFVLTSATFTALHFSPRTPLLMLAMTFVFSLFACAWVCRSQALWGVMGWHAGWNWFGGTGFAVPITGLDSTLPALVVKLVPVGPAYLTGGGEGPEGSVFTLALLVAATLGLSLAERKRARRRAGMPRTG